MTRPVSSLAPEPERRERMVRAILERAAPALAVHAVRRGHADCRGPAATLADWLRPALVAAAVVGLVAAAFLAGERSPARAQPAVSEALGYPAPVVAWIEAGRRPSVEELIVTMEVKSR